MPESERRKSGRRFADGWEGYSSVSDRYSTGVPVFKPWKSLNPPDQRLEKYAGEIDSEASDLRPSEPHEKGKKRKSDIVR